MNAKPLREVIKTPLGRTFRVYCHDYPFPYSGRHHHPDYECTQPKLLDGAPVFIAASFNRTDLTCREIAGREGMSLSAFSRFFERHVKCTCLEYVNRLRIYKACQLLLETDERITSICFDVGYDTPSTFNRNFMRMIRTSPSAFRMERRAAPGMSGTKQHKEEETPNVSWN
jgi:AraC-like DNA-binding protein